MNELYGVSQNQYFYFGKNFGFEGPKVRPEFISFALLVVCSRVQVALPEDDTQTVHVSVQVNLPGPTASST